MSYSEDNTEDIIRKRMQDNISSDIDKEEGSFVYDAISPTSKEIAQVYITNDDILERISPFTAKDADLDKITSSVGINRKEGGKATTQLLVTATIGTTISSNTLVQTPAGLIYKTVGDITTTTETTLIDIIASEIGSKYNLPSNIITQLPASFSGVISITNPEPITNGYDDESNESLRGRYFDRMRTPGTSGNKADYKIWAKEVIGVGDAKVTPLWNGNGTVKVTIINSNKKAADSELVQKVKDYIDPEPEGKGEGQAPIGAVCTVVSAEEKAMNITATVVLANGYTLQQAQDNFNTAFEKYLNDLAFNDTYVSYAKVGGILLSAGGIVDYSNLTLNNGTSNIALADEEIPVVGTINLGV